MLRSTLRARLCGSGRCSITSSGTNTERPAGNEMTSWTLPSQRSPDWRRMRRSRNTLRRTVPLSAML